MRARRPASVLRAADRNQRFRALVGLCGLLLVFPAGAGAQQLASLEADYAEARSEYEEVLAEREAAQTSYTRSLDLVRSARDHGDEGRVASAMATFYTQARALEEFDRRMEDADRRLEEVGRELIQLLDAREEELLNRLEDTADADEREELLEALAQVRQRVRRIEADVESLQEVSILPAPDIQPDPRDGPTETRAKHNLLTSRVQEFDLVLEEIDERLEALERRLRRNRSLEDQEAGLARFDDLMIAPRAPSGGQPRLEGLLPDGSAPPLGELPLEDQIALLEIIREQAQQVRDETRAQAEEFADRIPEGSR